jgi:hypothetical protein
MNRVGWISIVAVSCAGLWSPAAQAQPRSENRVALVIGNSAYADAPLLNPSNDAKAVAATLRAQGFTVHELYNAKKSQIEEALVNVARGPQARDGVGLFYYAGHGLQIDWRNYLLPVDANPASAADVPRQAVELQRILDALREAGSRIKIVVLDACRDNPFGASASGKGLAPLDAPHGTLVAYSTAPGNVASDGASTQAHGLYTGHLLKEMREPGSTIESVFKRVRLQVRRDSLGRQVPWESTSLEEDFYFATAEPVGRASQSEREEQFRREKADWDRIKDSTSADDFYAFLQRYPNGSLALLAQDRLDRIQRATIRPQQGRTNWTQPALDELVRDGDRFEYVYKDAASGAIRGVGAQEVRRVSPEEYELRSSGLARHTRLTRSGFTIQDGVGTYDPPYPLAPTGELAIGKSWTARSLRTRANGAKEHVEYVARIAATENVTVPAGTFTAFRIEVKVTEANAEPTNYTFWIAPESPIPIKYILEFRNSAGRRDHIQREVTLIRRQQ